MVPSFSLPFPASSSLPFTADVLFSSSLSHFTKALFPSSMFYQEVGRKADKSKNRQSKALGAGTKIFQATVGSQFKEALNQLAAKIWETTPYFVRCIKPNSIKRPKVFDNHEVSIQLNCGGVYEVFFSFLFGDLGAFLTFFNRPFES